MWKFTFWTNDNRSIVLNETACQGHCEIKNINQLSGFSEIKHIVNQLIDLKFYKIDILKAFILSEFGGVYMDLDYHFVMTQGFLHKDFDMYVGNSGRRLNSISVGVIGTRKNHQVLRTWK